VEDRIPQPVGHAHLELPAEPASAARARRFVADVLALWDCDDPYELAALLTSEVVTNAVRYAHQRLQVDVEADGTGVRVATTDDDPRVPRLATVPPEATGGRGLFLVDTLASRWGVDLDPPGKTVWFDLPLSPPAAASRTSERASDRQGSRGA
jgi:anti-sigma regulatory factor (Ser/Thr protein kinase)